MSDRPFQTGECSNLVGGYECTCHPHGKHPVADGVSDRTVCVRGGFALTCDDISCDRLHSDFEALVGSHLDGVLVRANVYENGVCREDASQGATCDCTLGAEHRGLNFSVCHDIDECETTNCGEHATCGNVIPGFLCTCDEGLAAEALDYDQAPVTCADRDECLVGVVSGENVVVSEEMYLSDVCL
ncbi:MAG: hypothetical protein KVP17_002131 [Porospora cf. gigantea B]|uniref:uncharacterized protein n=1 Tax=Porospora cf. gigantea B TaxID=2853592 RepID=UPI0035717A7E|nr:MAG: hypothetical protein KVP17_002131 [Porospora cf. gigantea B]